MGTEAFGRSGLTLTDRFGTWLSTRRLRRLVPSYRGLRVGDFGCGYHAAFVCTILDDVSHAVLVDRDVAPDLHSHPKTTVIEGELPGALVSVPDESLDVVLAVSVLEHLWQPAEALGHFRRVLAPGGTCLVNVPSWWGKRALELAAFRLGATDAAMIDDHKRYYDPRDLWPLLRAAGFHPRSIRCHRHKFGLNTLAVCRVERG
jgi:SAM-dependent methyltransferase